MLALIIRNWQGCWYSMFYIWRSFSHIIGNHFVLMIVFLRLLFSQKWGDVSAQINSLRHTHNLLQPALKQTSCLMWISSPLDLRSTKTPLNQALINLRTTKAPSTPPTNHLTKIPTNHLQRNGHKMSMAEASVLCLGALWKVIEIISVIVEDQLREPYLLRL